MLAEGLVLLVCWRFLFLFCFPLFWFSGRVGASCEVNISLFSCKLCVIGWLCSYLGLNRGYLCTRTLNLHKLLSRCARGWQSSCTEQSRLLRQRVLVSTEEIKRRCESGGVVVVNMRMLCLLISTESLVGVPGVPTKARCISCLSLGTWPSRAAGRLVPLMQRSWWDKGESAGGGKGGEGEGGGRRKVHGKLSSPDNSLLYYPLYILVFSPRICCKNNMQLIGLRIMAFLVQNSCNLWWISCLLVDVYVSHKWLTDNLLVA